MDQTTFNLLMTLLTGVAALACFASATCLVGIVANNRGAHINRTWSLFAIALTAFGLAEVDRFFETLGLPNLATWRPVARVIGALLLFVGASYGRALFKSLWIAKK